MVGLDHKNMAPDVHDPCVNSEIGTYDFHPLMMNGRERIAFVDMQASQEHVEQFLRRSFLHGLENFPSSTRYVKSTSWATWEK